jgi:hypothetical protein
MTEANAQNYARRWSLLWNVSMDDASVAAMQLAIEHQRSQGLLRQPPPETLFDRTLFARANQLAR